jgi:hypothetical protein
MTAEVVEIEQVSEEWDISSKIVFLVSVVNKIDVEEINNRRGYTAVPI